MGDRVEQSGLRRTVGCSLEAALGEPTDLVLAIAVAREPGLSIHESLSVEGEDGLLDTSEIVDASGTRWHTTRAPAGELRVRYEAEVFGRAHPRVVASHERIVFVRPSRYVQSDELAGGLVDPTEVEQLARLDPFDRVLAAQEWVASRLSYTPGSTSPIDGLPEVLATGAGVCRDFAHLLAGVLRATDLPARTVSVYAPHLEPMDFHAVVEVAIEDRWWVLDATGLAPRASMLRIATGRDAADTAFLANDGSSLVLTGIAVHAEVGEAAREVPEAFVHLG